MCVDWGPDDAPEYSLAMNSADASDPHDAITAAKRAYAVGSGPEAMRAFYDTWSTTYDEDFGGAGGYVYPAQVANVYLSHAKADDVPIADIGCGTGLVGLALAPSGRPIDGFDVSPGMLTKAGDKHVYRELIEADLTLASNQPGAYGAVVSSGTFTVGHLGPDALTKALGLGRASALCVIGINSQHYRDAGFADCVTKWTESGAISDLQVRTVPIYRDAGNPEDPADVALVLVFRLANAALLT